MRRDRKLQKICLLGATVLIASTPLFAAEALPMQSNFLVNNQKVNVDAYTINGNNYFKLRDLAMALKGTEKEFEVEWASSLNAINLITGQAYTVEGGELVKGSSIKQEASVSSSQIYKDGAAVNLSVYKIGDSNYFKLRDLGELLDIDVEWISETSTVKVDVPTSNSQNAEDNLVVIQREALALPVKEISQYPTSQEEYENILLYMMDANLETYEVTYKGDMYERIENGQVQQVIKDAYTQVFSQYIEQFGVMEGLGINIEGNERIGKIQLRLYPINGYELKVMNDEFFEGCISIVNELISQGKITKVMTETEKAKVLYEWVVLNLEYDSQESPISHTGYGAMTNKKAVCQGYTALYNTLCKLVGIEIRGVVGTAGEAKVDHSWSLATLDGEKVYIDVTYGDPPSSTKKGICDWRYFMASEEFLSRDHFWDKRIIDR